MIGLRRKRRTAGPETGEAPSPPDPGVDAVEALPDAESLVDLVAEMLRGWGDGAFDVGERVAERIRADFDGWARHVVTGTPPPGRDAPEREAGTDRRDWPGVLRFTREHRRGEAAWVTRSVGNLGQVVRMFTQMVGRALHDDRRDDADVTSQLAELRGAVDRNDPEAVMREALKTAGLVEGVIRERRARAEEQVRLMASKLEALEVGLVETGDDLERDELTGAATHDALARTLQEVVSVGAVTGRSALLYRVAVDDFKWVQERFGEATAHEVLGQVAGRLGAPLRREQHVVARVGESAFAVVAWDVDPAEAESLGERLVHGIRDLGIDSPEPDGELIRVSVSVGCAALAPGEEAAAWLERCERALDAAEEAGRDRLSVDPPGRDAP